MLPVKFRAPTWRYCLTFSRSDPVGFLLDRAFYRNTFDRMGYTYEYDKDSHPLLVGQGEGFKFEFFHCDDTLHIRKHSYVRVNGSLY